MNNIKWYVTTILMPDDVLYVGITELDYGIDITISEHDTEEEADEACRQYSIENNIPLFEEYREDV
jgi:hypothetical protein